MKLAFFLGHVPALSLAEIYAVFTRAGMDFRALALSAEVLLAEVTGGGEVMGLIDRLGGAVKVAEVTARTPAQPTEEDIRALLPRTARKIFFGISAYALEHDARPVPTKRLGLAVKRLLEEEEKSSRLVTSREDTLSAVVINTNKLLSERGAEVVVLSVQGGAYLGRTVWVQPYEDYARRDMGRPQRDAFVGMLPPKLAHMMVNLALGAPVSRTRLRGHEGEEPAEAGSVLLDPCCGSGTVLQEAALMGVVTLIGTDRDGGAIKRTHANLQWLAALTPAMRTSQFSLTLKCAEVRSLPALLRLQPVDAVVSEPSLGPPQTRAVTPAEARRYARELVPLYQEVLAACSTLLKPGGRAVIVWPVWRGEQAAPVFLDEGENIAAHGLEAVDPLAVPLPSFPGVQEGCLRSRKSLLYQREDQFVLREIKIFDKV